jgi:hypothetical protein
VDVERLRRKQADRYAVLRAVYDLTDGRRYSAVAPEEAAERTGLAVDAFLEVSSYLEDEGLLEPAATDGSVFITHAGVVEVEASITAPDRPTDHFPLLVFHQTFNAPVGAVQTGAGAAAAVRQEVGLAPEDVAPLVAALRPLLADRPEARAALAELEEEVEAPAPRAARLKAIAAGLWTFTKDLATVAPKVLEIAEKLGLRLPGA